MRRLTVLLAAICLIAAACSSDSDSADATTTTAASGGSGDTTTTDAATSAETTTTEPATTTTAAAATTTTTVAAAASLDECVIGTWVMDSEAFFDVVRASGDLGDAPGEIAFLGGEYVLIIGGDGSFEVERNDWSFGVTSDDGEIQLIINAVDVGTWSIDGDVLSTTVTADADPDIAILIDGEPVSLPIGAVPIEPPKAEFVGAVVTCDGDILTATFEGNTSSWTRRS